jgi:hypothetical protein
MVPTVIACFAAVYCFVLGFAVHYCVSQIRSNRLKRLAKRKAAIDKFVEDLQYHQDRMIHAFKCIQKEKLRLPKIRPSKFGS